QVHAGKLAAHCSHFASGSALAPAAPPPVPPEPPAGLPPAPAGAFPPAPAALVPPSGTPAFPADDPASPLLPEDPDEPAAPVGLPGAELELPHAHQTNMDPTANIPLRAIARM